jgi:hypothetical protein
MTKTSGRWSTGVVRGAWAAVVNEQQWTQCCQAGGWIGRDIPGECRVRRQITYLGKGDDPKSAPPFGAWLWMSRGARPQLGTSLRGHPIS